jgi:predicted aspartyl protease
LAARAAASDSNLFVLRDAEQGIVLEAVPIADGETKTFRVGLGHETIDVIVPVSPGQSGNVVQRSQGEYVVEVRRDGDSLHTTIRKGDGSSRDYPTVSLEDLATYDVRVNVISAEGEESVYAIRGWTEVTKEDGPVIDLFGGKVPLQPGDVSITMQTSVHEESPGVEGTAPVEFSEGLFFARGYFAPGVDGDFIIDFGATGSVVVRWFLPKDAEIRELKAVEYSDEGVRELDATLRAAGGDVEDFLGVATLDELHVGGITFKDVTVNVIEEMPEIVDHMVVGVIGANLLHQAKVAALDYKTSPGVTPALTLSSESAHKGVDGVAEVPFTLAQGHIFVPGSVESAPASFLLDTGARQSVVVLQIVRDIGHSMLMGPNRTIRGLDAEPISVGFIHPAEVKIGDVSLKETTLGATDLPVLMDMGLGENGGLLGNDILGRFRRVEIDLLDNVIRLIQ